MSTDRERQQLAEMRRQIASLKDQIAKRPLRVKGGGTALHTLAIDRGNTLDDGITLGIKYADPAPTTVPSLYTTADTSFVDGIGRATLYIDGVSQGLVLVAHYAGNGSPYVLALVSGQTPVTTAATTTLPLVSDSTQTITLYIPQSP
jgi:hypothetical protein